MIEGSSLNKWYNINFNKEIYTNAIYHVSLKCLATISLVAAAALGFSALVLSYLAVSGTFMAITVAASSLLSFPFGAGASFLWNRSKRYLALEMRERNIANNFEKLKKDYLEKDGSFNTTRFAENFQGCDLTLTEKVAQEIGSTLPKETSKKKVTEAWLKVLARFQYYKERTTNNYEALDKKRNFLKKKCNESQIELRSEDATDLDRRVEYLIGPSILMTALCYKLLKEPFTKANTYNDLGRLALRLDTRFWSYDILGNDDYFKPKENNKKSIERDTILDVAKALTNNSNQPYQQLSQLTENLFNPIDLPLANNTPSSTPTQEKQEKTHDDSFHQPEDPRDLPNSPINSPDVTPFEQPPINNVILTNRSIEISEYLKSLEPERPVPGQFRDLERVREVMFKSVSINNSSINLKPDNQAGSYDNEPGTEQKFSSTF